MFDIDYYNEKFKDNLASNDMGEWKLVGSVIKNTKVTLPNEYEEIYCCCYDTTNRNVYNVTMSKDQFNNLKAIDSNNEHAINMGYNTYISYVPSYNQIYFAVYNGNITTNLTNCQLNVYYR